MVALVIDGTSCSGKSVLLQGLKRTAQARAPNHTALFLTEHMTERVFEGRQPAVAEVHAHVARVLGLVATAEGIRAGGPFASNARVLTMAVERLFLTFSSRRLMTDVFFTDHAALIAATRLRHVFLRVPEDQFADRIVLSLSHRNQRWTDYVESLGGLAGAVRHFMGRQSAMAEAEAQLPAAIERVTIEASDLDMLGDEGLHERLLWRPLDRLDPAGTGD